ncbi:MAG: DUF1186 family protein [Chlamydiales bacterium]|nr:DUF1186 family protein [Chlamydiales bacterium]
MTDISTYIEQISNWQDEFPENALAHLIDRESESKPYLRDLLEKTLIHYKEIPDEFVGHIYALYALAFFRDPAGFTLAISFLELPEPYPRAFFHHFLEQSYPSVIASCYAGNPEPLYELVTNKNAGYISRVIACVALSILVNRNSLPRAQYAKFLLGVLETESDKKLLATLAQEVAELHLQEAYDKIKSLYQSKAIDEEQFSSKLFETLMQSDEINPDKFFLIDDVFEELNGQEYSGQE